MDPLVTSSLVSAGSSLLGGLFGGGSQKATAQSDMNNELLGQQFTWQRRLHQDTSKFLWRNQIPTTVAAAKSAGIHPLVAMGVNPSGGSTGSFAIGGGSDAPNALGAGLADMGQHLGRAAQAYLTRDERNVQQSMTALQLERASLENDLLRSQITSVKANTVPALPSPSSRYLIEGQGETHLPPVSAHSGQVIPEMQTVRTAHGDRVIPSDEYARIMENYWPEAYRYMFSEVLRDVKSYLSTPRKPGLLWSRRSDGGR